MESHPHRSTTHKEMFFHIQYDPALAPFLGATVFAREENGTWYASTALCSPHDDFCRRRGRTVARRRYFLAKMRGSAVQVRPICKDGKPTYEQAQTLARFHMLGLEVPHYG